MKEGFVFFCCVEIDFIGCIEKLEYGRTSFNFGAHN